MCAGRRAGWAGRACLFSPSNKTGQLPVVLFNMYIHGRGCLYSVVGANARSRLPCRAGLATCVVD